LRHVREGERDGLSDRAADAHALEWRVTRPEVELLAGIALELAGGMVDRDEHRTIRRRAHADVPAGVLHFAHAGASKDQGFIARCAHASSPPSGPGERDHHGDDRAPLDGLLREIATVTARVF